MSREQWKKIIVNALKFTFIRPFKRYNNEGRSKKYLGPDAKYFTPAPMAIGSMAGQDFRSVKYQRRHQITSKSEDDSELRDKFIADASQKLKVIKSLTYRLPRLEMPDIEARVEPETTANQLQNTTNHRPLPVRRNLPLQDLRSVWMVEKVPRGRLDMNQLQAIMLSVLDDPDKWTPKAISEKYDIKEEYAANLIKYLQQIRIVVSPHMARMLDYVGREDPEYQASKHLVYYTDKRLRTETDKKFDEMFLPEEEELDEKVRNLFEDDTKTVIQAEERKMVRRPEALKLSSLNKSTTSPPEPTVIKRPAIKQIK